MWGQDWLIIARDVFLVLTWVVASIYLFSGLQDFRYDLYSLALRAIRRFKFRKRERLTKARLRMREQQWIAVMVPAWNEGEVIGEMVKNILERVEYKNYRVFVGVYPNDAATNAAVDRHAAEHESLIKVVTARPGPTNKADCLNNVLQAIEKYEVTHGINFDIIAMHDAEDVVHPFSFLLYNYLIPRIDVVQLPILPLPTSLKKLVHWVYADEFCENHMKDVPARELMTGFVPYAGVGTGFSRRVMHFLKELHHGQVFNESSLTEDYSMSKKILDSGYTSAFVNLLLADDDSKWWTPLCQRSGFISNWAYFPFDYKRSVRQKSRWILGISIQEWTLTGWQGGWRIRENLLKDRKVFVAMTATLLGYLCFIYVALDFMGRWGWVPFQLHPVVVPGTVLFQMLVVVLGLSFVRLFQRMSFVTAVYGIKPALLAAPRMMLGNIINGHAAFLALKAFSDSQRGRQAMKWAKTDHMEGVGAQPFEMERPPAPAEHEVELSVAELCLKLRARDSAEVIGTLERIRATLGDGERQPILHELERLVHSKDPLVRAAVGNAIGRLAWAELMPELCILVGDHEWPVRANATSALLDQPNFGELADLVLISRDKFAIETLVKMLEQDEPKLAQLAEGGSLSNRARNVLLERSKVFQRFAQRPAA